MTFTLSASRTPASSAPSTLESRASEDTAPLRLRAVLPGDWDREVAGFDGLCQEQTHAFAAARWPGLVPRPVLFERNGAVVGGALVLVGALPLRLARLAVVKWGPMLRDEDAPEAAALYRAMVVALLDQLSRREAMMVSIVPRPLADGSEIRTLCELGFSEGSGLRFPDRYLVSLRHEEAERMAGFAQKWRYHLRKSFKAGLEFERSGPEGLQEFMALYEAMSARKQFPDHSAIATLPALMAMPEGTARPELFFVRKEGRAVAGAVIFTAGRTATYLYGATDDDALELRAGYFLHWHVMRWLVAHTRADQYDLGGTDGFAGLAQFKRGMVGTLGHVTPIPPMMHFAHRLRPRILGRTAFALRDTALRKREDFRQWREARKPSATDGGGERG